MRGFRLTLRAKGTVALLLLAAYLAGLGFYTSSQRERLLYIFEQMELTHERHEQLIYLSNALMHSSVLLQETIDSGSTRPLPRPVQQALDAALRQLAAMAPVSTPGAELAQRFEQQAKLAAQPLAPEQLLALRDAEAALSSQVARVVAVVAEQDRELARHYALFNHRITVNLAVAVLLGVAFFGSVAIVFFSRLAADIGQLEVRALALADEDGTEPTELTRRDEVGGLMRAITRMTRELHEREQRQELWRQQQFHQEKMAAVGSAAANLAHEIGNPINAISGIAQYTIDAIGAGQRPDDDWLLQNAHLTVRQTERIGNIVRQLADLSAPRPLDPELLSLNDIVRATCGFIRYDRRLKNMEITLDLEPQLPALRAVADHLTQVLMNLLLNAADALEECGREHPAIRVATRIQGKQVLLSVADNGNGMAPDVQRRAFQQSFTTKPAGRGRGIGLYLCKMLIEDMGGSIALDSTPGAGTTAILQFPMTGTTGA